MFEFVSIKDVKNTIAEWCVALRKAENMTQQELADELGLSRLTISNLEKGENPTLETLLKVLQYFDQMKALNQFVSSKIDRLDHNESMY